MGRVSKCAKFAIILFSVFTVLQTSTFARPDLALSPWVQPKERGSYSSERCQGILSILNELLGPTYLSKSKIDTHEPRSKALRNLTLWTTANPIRLNGLIEDGKWLPVMLALD